MSDLKKQFALVNILCDKKQSNSLPQHESVELLVSEFGNYFKDKINAIRNNLGAFEPPSIPTREWVDDKLDTFALVSEDDAFY